MSIRNKKISKYRKCSVSNEKLEQLKTSERKDCKGSKASVSHWTVSSTPTCILGFLQESWDIENKLFEHFPNTMKILTSQTEEVH